MLDDVPPALSLAPCPAGLMLAIETSNPSALQPDASGGPGVALVDIIHAKDPGLMPAARVASVRALESLTPSSSQHDDLAGAIARCFARAAASHRDVRSISVSIGPGGFTSVRIAVTTAKCIAEATGAACIGVPSAHVVARGHPGPGPFCVALASKGHDAFVTVFRDSCTARGPGTILDAQGLEDLSRQGITVLVADQHLPPSMRQRAMDLGMAIHPPTFHPVYCAHAACDLPPTPDPAHLLPVYPREPEAVTKWRALHGRMA